MRREAGDSRLGPPPAPTSAQIIDLARIRGETGVRVIPPEPPSLGPPAAAPSDPARPRARARTVRPQPDGPREARLGRRIQRTRRARRLTIDAVSGQTRIRPAYLRAIESGALSALPPAPYGGAFIREYAGFVAADPAELLEAYARLHPAETHLDAIPRVPQRRRRLWVSWLAAAVLAVGVLVVLTVLGVLGAGDRPARIPVRADRALRPAAEPATPAAQPSAAPSSAAATLVPAPGTVVVQISVTRDACWVKAVVDGKLVLQDTLPSGEVRTFTGRQVALTLGNAGAVRLGVNGRDFGVPGGDGQVYHNVFQPEA